MRTSSYCKCQAFVARICYVINCREGGVTPLENGTCSCTCHLPKGDVGPIERNISYLDKDNLGRGGIR